MKPKKFKDWEKSNNPFLSIGEILTDVTSDNIKEISNFYLFNPESDSIIRIKGYTGHLFKRFLDTIYRDYLQVIKNNAIYNSIDSRLYNGGNGNEIDCEFLDIMRENAWMTVIIRLYGLFSDSQNDFYTLSNFITILESIYSADVDDLNEKLREIRQDETSFGTVKILRNKIHAHRDPECQVSLNRNHVVGPLKTLANQIIEKAIDISCLKPYGYSETINLYDFNGNCIWAHIDLKRIHS